MNQDAGLVGMGVGTASTRYYCLGLATNRVVLYRWAGGNTLLFSDPVTVRQTNIVLCFALTRHNSQAIVTIRVEDRTAPGTVLYQTNYRDLAPVLSGNSVGLVVEPKPALPASDASAAFDNFTKRTYDVARVGVERALRLSWPDTGMNFTLERASSLEGPWLPVQSSEVPGMHYFTVPTSATKEFYQLQQAP
jgi:hypothetical protein